MTAWIVILLVGGGTYLLRASMFIALGTRSLPAWTQQPLTLVGPAAIAALLGSVVFTAPNLRGAEGVPELVAIVLAFVAVRRTGNVAHAFAIGLPVVWMLSAIWS